MRSSLDNDKKEVLVGIPFLSIPRVDEDENPLAPGVVSSFDGAGVSAQQAEYELSSNSIYSLGLSHFIIDSITIHELLLINISQEQNS